MSRSTLKVPGGALMVVLLLATCSGGGTPTNAPPTAAPPTATIPQATPAPVATVNPTPNATTPAADEGRIAFGVRAGDGSNIFSMFPDGTDMTQLTTDAGNHLCASYSADAS